MVFNLLSFVTLQPPGIEPSEDPVLQARLFAYGGGYRFLQSLDRQPDLF